jgi:hypothetical protein
MLDFILALIVFTIVAHIVRAVVVAAAGGIVAAVRYLRREGRFPG